MHCLLYDLWKRVNETVIRYDLKRFHICGGCLTILCSINKHALQNECYAIIFPKRLHFGQNPGGTLRMLRN